MRKILSLLTGCLLIAGLCVAPRTVAAPLAAPVTQAALAYAGGGHYEPIDARRVLDTRSGLGGFKGLLAPGRTLTFQAAKTTPYPPPKAAVFVVTVPTPAPAGSLSVYPSGTGWDGRVTMTLTGGGNIQQQLTVALGPGQGVTIRSNAARSTHLIVDVVGYYDAGPAVSNGMFGLANGRVLDTRTGLSAPRAAVGPGKKVTVAFAGRGGVPAAGALAVIANVAVLSARAAGQLVITSSDGKLATTRLRFPGNQSVPQTMQTERAVKLGGNGTLTFTNSSTSSVQLVVDVAGYFVHGPLPSPNEVGDYVPLSPQPVKPVVLHGLRHTALYLPGTSSYEDIAANIVLTTDDPTQSTALAVYGPSAPWTGSPIVSSSASLQPSEITVGTEAWYTVGLGSLYKSEVYLHCYVTGYYHLPFGL